MAGQAVGNAYVEVTPKVGKVEGEEKLKGLGGKGGDQYGEGFGAAAKGKISAMSVAMGNIMADAVKMGIGAVKDVMGDAITGFADYEQLVGGMDTLFKDSSGKMQQYASEAYKTAQMSANDYMQLSTDFAASMIQSVGGDTAKAADLSNQAVIDMADNANKMGTSMQDIENAYKGFSKQNYTMLDNLNYMGALAA